MRPDARRWVAGSLRTRPIYPVSGQECPLLGWLGPVVSARYAPPFWQSILAGLAFSGLSAWSSVVHAVEPSIWYRTGDGCPDGASFLERLGGQSVPARLAAVGDHVDFVVTCPTGPHAPDSECETDGLACLYRYEDGAALGQQQCYCARTSGDKHIWKCFQGNADERCPAAPPEHGSDCYGYFDLGCVYPPGIECSCDSSEGTWDCPSPEIEQPPIHLKRSIRRYSLPSSPMRKEKRGVNGIPGSTLVVPDIPRWPIVPSKEATRPAPLALSAACTVRLPFQLFRWRNVWPT